MSTRIVQTQDDTASSVRSRLGSLLGIQVLGLGSSVPDNVVKNEDLAALGCDPEWIIQRSGIVERRHAPPGTATSDLAVQAAQRCIEEAGVDPDDIDLVLVGTYTPDLLLPTVACLVQDRLGLRAPALDLHAACAGFVYALVTGAQFVATGCSRLVLVIGADCNSRVVDPKDIRTYPLFGDGAGAVLLGAGSRQQGLLAYAMGADGSGGDMLIRRMGGTLMPYTPDPAAAGLQYLHMEGRQVFKWAVRVLAESVTEVVRAAELTLDDLDLVVFHQANLRIIASAAKELGLAPTKVFNNLDRYGNTSAASIPLCLDEAFHEGRIQRGHRILISGFGAGLTWATALLQW